MGHMHWVDVYAEKLLEKGDAHVIESGTGISGQPHLGSASDIIYADGILKAIIQKGGKARAIWAMDDMDGLRKIPPQLPKDFDKYIGQPAFKLPCPDGCCGSFVEHFTAPFLKNLERIDVRPEAVSVAQMYRDGRYDAVVKKALARAEEIRAILRDVSGSERDDDWLPFFPICENCGRILTTKAHGFDGRKVGYVCSGGVAGKKKIPGCGHEGEAGIRDGKLPWRVEWPARWSHLGVTCEPMGKDLMAAGGTYESSRVICERIFESPAPEPVPYEWIVDGEGKRLGKSLGRVVTLGELVDMVTPEVARYFFFRTNPTSHKVLEFRHTIPKLAEEYEQAERVFFGDTGGVPVKEIDDIRRSYEISQISGVPEAPGQASYSQMISIIQTNTVGDKINWDGVLAVLQRLDNTPSLDDRTIRLGTGVKRWLDEHAPEDVKFAIQPEMPDVELSDADAEFISALADAISVIEWKAEKIHDAIYQTSQARGMKAGQCFRALYKIFLGKSQGPRLGFLLASLGRDFVMGRISEAAAK